MDRTKCRACVNEDLELLLDLGPQPLAGGFLPPDADAIEREKTYPLPIHICKRCGLVQTLHVIPPDILFTNYCFSSSTVRPLVEHFQQYASWLKDKLRPRIVVEFGCNDGILLTPLEKLGIRTCGIDISENITRMAREKGLNVITGFFNEQSAARIEDEFGKADVITGSNCFPHNDNPDLILRAARRLLKHDGHLCLEVMYAGDLLEASQWDSMYHEHLSYFCLQTLERLLRRFGFHTVDVERIPIHAGSLRVVAAVNEREAVKPSVHAVLQYEHRLRLTEIDTWRVFSQVVKRKIHVVKSIFDKLKVNSRIWGYGAAGRATMWVNACQMNYLEAVVDSSPLRAGRLMPGTHTPIVFPEALRAAPPDYIFVPAWNYLKQIRAKETWYKGTWAVPLPELIFT
jgi:2-polyprenyl-3-methyl-5-hydroxy-6-metoxy-1,4-benzoquinol methylase